ARIEADLREWEANRPVPAPAPPPAGPPPPASGTGFLLPTQGWQSSPYGMRFDPFFRVWQLHAGVDIAAPGGAPVYAVADGTVVRAGWNGGYGNFTCLGHGSHRGQGLATCYAHQSAILVGAGQQVRRGEVIGRVGTTGASTGNHLHFEVRLDGSPTDPIPFLPGF
ncbi:MAG: M23 family metallopeptidase, partial [Natronosporangium sp.]